MAEQYVNIRIILDKLTRHPLMQDLSLETVVDYTVDFMRIVGVPSMFEEKVELLELKDNRAMLPCDLYQVIQIKSNRYNNAVFRYSTDSFHMDGCSGCGDLTYKIQGNVIYTSIKEGEIILSYEAIPTDKDGYPVIPDNSSFTRALMLYIKKEYFTMLFESSKISSAILQNIQQEYAWAVGDCQSEFNRLTIDKAESFYNSWRTLIVRANEHRTGFKNNGAMERIKLH